MSTIIEILATDQPKDSREDINANFAALNADKLEFGVAVPGNLAVNGTLQTSGVWEINNNGMGALLLVDGVAAEKFSIVNDNAYPGWLLKSLNGASSFSDISFAPNGTEGLRVGQNGNVTVAGKLVTTQQTPASAAAAGTTGQIAVDANFIYVCTATNTWKRVAISTW